MGHVTLTQRGQRLAPIVLCPNHTLSQIAKENREHLCAEQDISLNKQLSASLLPNSFLLSCVQHYTFHWVLLTWTISEPRLYWHTSYPMSCAQSITDQKKACLDLIQSCPLAQDEFHWLVKNWYCWLGTTKQVYSTVASPSPLEVGGGT